MDEKFQIYIEKACPACSQNCPGVEIKTMDFYSSFDSNEVIERSRYCENFYLCKYLWNYLEKHKDDLESH